MPGRRVPSSNRASVRPPLIPPGLRISILLRKSIFPPARPRRYLPVLVLFCLCLIVPAVADAGGDYWAPWVTKTTTTSATINWQGETDGSGSIDYATANYYKEHNGFNKTVTAPTNSTFQHVPLTDLEPNTAYVYKVKPSGKEDVFSNRAFQTMPISGPFTFIVISDSQEGHHYTEGKRFKCVADAVAKETDILFVLHGGDYAGFDDETLWDTFFQVADGMLAKFAIFSCIGNHEYHNPAGESNPPTAADHYHWAYDMPLNYSFDCAGIRFVILNSPDPNNAGDGDDPQPSLALTESQAGWLRDQLDNPMSGTFTMHHHPIWDNGRTTADTSLEPWETLYHTYRISATFAGHTHNYQRFLVEGIPYFIVGNAGGRFADLTGPAPVWFQFGGTRELGYLKVSVDPANNTATAQEIFVASVKDDDSDETPLVHDPPIIADTVTFPLKWKQPSEDEGCFIATAAYGSYVHSSVRILREFRDTFLIPNPVGKAVVKLYYRISPGIADAIRSNETLKAGTRILLLPAVGLSCLCLRLGFLPGLCLPLLFVAMIYGGIKKRWFPHAARR